MLAIKGVEANTSDKLVLREITALEFGHKIKEQQHRSKAASVTRRSYNFGIQDNPKSGSLALSGHRSAFAAGKFQLRRRSPSG
jgi:hypothetical protein